MCPFCVLTTIVVASGAISAGGVGAIFIGKRRSKHAMNSAGIAQEPAQEPARFGSLPMQETMSSAAYQKLFTTDEAES